MNGEELQPPDMPNANSVLTEVRSLLERLSTSPLLRVCTKEGKCPHCRERRWIPDAEHRAIFTCPQCFREAPLEAWALEPVYVFEREPKRDAEKALGESLVRLLFAELRHPSWLRRTYAVDWVGKLGEHEIPVDLLLPLLSDRSRAVRTTVVHVLEMAKERIPVQQVQMLVRSSRKDVRVAAFDLMGRLGDAIPLEVLMAGLDDRSEEVQYTALWALGMRGGSAAHERIAVYLLDDGRPEHVRTRFIKLLDVQWKISPGWLDTARDIFLHVLAGDQGPSSRHEAAQRFLEHHAGSH